MGQFPIELVRSVVAGELDLALVIAPTLDANITAVPFDQTPLYAALPENHPAAGVEQLALRFWLRTNGFCFRDDFIRLSMTLL
jgi:DNA-binding transcriptional LysR family regulator